MSENFEKLVLANLLAISNDLSEVRDTLRDYGRRLTSLEGTVEKLGTDKTDSLINRLQDLLKLKERTMIGPKGEKRPANVIANAVKVMKIATGEETEELVSNGKSDAAMKLGHNGGKARAAGMSPERRKEIAQKAAKARWVK